MSQIVESGGDLRSKSRRAGRVLLLFIFFIAVALVWVWLFTGSQRQDKWMRTAVIGLFAWSGFLVWVLFGSRWRARTRWSVFIGTIAVLGFCGLTLRIKG